MSRLSIFSVLPLLQLVIAQNASTILPNTYVTTTLGSFEISNSTACACNHLLSTHPSLVLTPDSANYTVQATDYWDIKADLSPACIFLPIDADQVADAVSIFNTCNAQFAIRGGGHMNYPGSNNIDGGVLLALNSLTDIEIAPDNSTIAVGPGNRWVDVYAALSAIGRYAIGGRMKTIGVPGLTLIGGFHYFINKYGFAMDNVVSYDVVLGNGTLVTANATSCRDLFWALKGGANNFGVVTKFIFRTLPIPLISTAILEYNESAVPAFIQAACDLVNNDDATLGAGSIITISYNATTKVVSPSILGVQEGTESPPSRFANFSAIGPVYSQYNVTPPIVWHEQLDSPFQMFRNGFAQHTIKPDADQIYLLYQLWKDAVDKISDVEGLYPTFVLNILPKSAAAVAKYNGIGNTWGLDDSENYILWQISTGWSLAQDDLRMTNWQETLLEHLHDLNIAAGLATDFIYMGDAGNFQNPFDGFPAANVQRMREIQADYDVKGVFTRLNWGGFKLGYY